jgi:23S rRNA (cytosine1962-C5)-methyltransferase
LGRHPWVYSGAIDQIDDGFTAGDVVKVFSADQKFLGLGYINPRSQIAVRMLAFEDVSINDGFFEKRISEALRLRQGLIPPDTDAYRLIHSEGDFLPGLIADRYGDYLVLEFLTAGMDRWKETVVRILAGELPVRGIFEKDDSEWREAEGLEKRVGKLWGEDPPDFVEIRENGLAFIADIHGGQKTGFFIDQRDNRKLVGGFAKDRRVLNAFCYTGAFTVYAARGGAAQSVSADISEVAINTARIHFRKNGLDESAHTLVCEDVFEYLRSSRQEFDMIVLDPPAFCKNQHQLQSASRGYKDINLYALKRLAPGGLLFTASCSSHVAPELFQKIVFGAAKDARRNLRILQKTAHPPDHPVNIYHPEGEYLKGLLCEVA